MQRTHNKHIRLIALLLLAFLVGGFGWKLSAQVHQENLNFRLIAAIKHDDTSTAIALLAQGADPNALDTSLDSRSVWRQLWDHLRGKHPAKKVASTALLLAVQGPVGEGVPKENVPVVKALLDKGADVNARNEQGTTALMSAVAYDHIQTVKLLLKKGANVNLRDKPFYLDISELGRIYHTLQSGRTALMYASEMNDDLVIMKLLLDHGANANDADLQHNTLLMAAAGSGNIEKVRLLLDKGADVNARDNLGSTPLIIASNNGDLDIMRLLLQRGAQVNAREANGETALMEAAQLGHTEAVRFLLAAGAQVSLRTRDGKTALMLAQDHRDVVSLLKKAGEKK